MTFLFWQRLVDASVALHFGFVVGFFLDDLSPFEPLLPLQNDGVGAVGHLQHLQDACHCANLVQVLWSGNFGVVFFLAHHANQGLRFVRLTDQANASVAAHTDGNHHSREQHGVAQGEERKDFRNLFLLHRSFVLLRQDGDEILVLDVAQTHGLLHLTRRMSKGVPKRRAPPSFFKPTTSCPFRCAKAT